jgi:hypothetical protein
MYIQIKCGNALKLCVFLRKGNDIEIETVLFIIIIIIIIIIVIIIIIII